MTDPDPFCPECGSCWRDAACSDEWHDTNPEPAKTPDIYWLRVTEDEALHLRLAVRASRNEYTASEWSVLGPLEDRLMECKPVAKKVQPVPSYPWPWYGGVAS